MSKPVDLSLLQPRANFDAKLRILCAHNYSLHSPYSPQNTRSNKRVRDSAVYNILRQQLPYNCEKRSGDSQADFWVMVDDSSINFC